MDPRRRTLTRLTAALALMFACTVQANTDLRAPIAAIAATLDSRVSSTLERISDDGAKLVALRAYLRAEADFAQRWSWTQQQIDAYSRSTAEHALLADIARVRQEFERRNPGHSLFVNPQVRSLELQITRWNQNASVRAAAREFEAAARARWESRAGDPQQRLRDFRVFLEGHYPQPTPTLAAPGLSRHGRMHAVDFQVQRQGAIVAGTDSAAVARQWLASGWKARLREAVIASKAPFQGPLDQPHEPWHYEYAATAQIPPAAPAQDAHLP